MKIAHFTGLGMLLFLLIYFPACGFDDPDSEQTPLLNLGEGRNVARDQLTCCQTTTTTSSSSTTTATVEVKEIFLTGLRTPAAITFDDSGNLFVANRESQEILKFDPARAMQVFVRSGAINDVAWNRNLGLLAGTDSGYRQYSAGGVLQTVATGTLTSYVGPAVDSISRLYLASREDTQGRIWRVAGTAFTQFLLGQSSGITAIRDLVCDSQDNLYVTSGSALYHVTSGGVVTLVTAGLLYPEQICLHESYLYIAERNGGRLTRIGTLDGSVSHLLTGIDSPRGVAVQGGYLYWTTDLVDNAVVGRALLSQLPAGGIKK